MRLHLMFIDVNGEHYCDADNVPLVGERMWASVMQQSPVGERVVSEWWFVEKVEHILTRGKMMTTVFVRRAVKP